MHQFLHFLSLTLLLTLISCSLSEVKISGQVEGVQDGTIALARLDLANNTTELMDSTPIINGRFTFKRPKQIPYLYSIIFNDTTKFSFFLEDEDINLKATIKDGQFQLLAITSGPEDQLFRQYEIDSIFERSSGWGIMRDHPQTVFAVFTAYYQFQLHNYSVQEMDELLESFSEDSQRSIYYHAILPLYQKIKNTAIGQLAPTFSAPDTSGHNRHLEDFRGKYVLLDFWASWCAPCRAENPKWVEFYYQINKAEFEILGISVDEDEERWKKAIVMDQLPWTNVSLLEGWSNISDQYGVKAVPQNFLIDPSGKIIAKNISVDELQELLLPVNPI
jgi:peroxiredoxin